MHDSLVAKLLISEHLILYFLDGTYIPFVIFLIVSLKSALGTFCEIMNEGGMHPTALVCNIPTFAGLMFYLGHSSVIHLCIPTYRAPYHFAMCSAFKVIAILY